MTMCLTIRGSPVEITVSKDTIYRDVGIYLFSAVVIIIFALTNYIYWYSAAVSKYF